MTTASLTDTRLPSGSALLQRPAARFVMVVALVMLIGLVFSAIGGATAADPEITSVAPAAVDASPSPTSVTVTGANFAPRLTLTVTGPDGSATDYREPTIAQLRDSSFIVPVAFPVAGRYQFVITNADRSKSKPFVATAKPQANAPSISGVLPARLQASPNSQTLTIQGQNFAPGMTISVTDPAGSVQDIPAGAINDVRPTSVQIAVTLSIEGDYAIVATSPSRGTSNTFGFRVGPAF